MGLDADERSGTTAGLLGASAIETGCLSRWSERGGSPRVARLLPSPSPVGIGAFSLRPSPRGAFSALVPFPFSATEGVGVEGAWEAVASSVELSVRAVGLNFRDVLNVLGAYPGDPGPPGTDCSGVVVGGAGEVGAPVFGLAPGALGTHASALTDLLPPKPPALSFEAAASLPTVCATVDLALRHSAGVCAGAAPVLVHAAAGGVGLAAVGALAAAGTVACLATAGSPHKRALLRSLGEQRVAGSRDTAFAEVVALCTRGSGAAAVLNSLTSAGMVGASLASLGARGCLTDIGKRDVWSPARAAAERADAAYGLVALDFSPASRLVCSLHRVAAAAARGALAPLPSASYALGSAPSALRALAHALHAGKVVVRSRDPSLSCAGMPDCASDLALVVGGLGALGTLAAKWMSQRGCEGPGGAARLLLLGRSGRYTASESAPFLCTARSAALATFGRCDAACSGEASAALPLAGACAGGCSGRLATLVHAGGVLQDATLGNQTASGARAVVAPKVDCLRGIRFMGVFAVDSSPLPLKG